jgi:hypothetical protein
MRGEPTKFSIPNMALQGGAGQVGELNKLARGLRVDSVHDVNEGAAVAIRCKRTELRITLWGCVGMRLVAHDIVGNYAYDVADVMVHNDRYIASCLAPLLVGQTLHSIEVLDRTRVLLSTCDDLDTREIILSVRFTDAAPVYSPATWSFEVATLIKRKCKGCPYADDREEGGE